MFGFISSIAVCGLGVILAGAFAVYLLRRIILRAGDNEDKLGFAVSAVLTAVFLFYTVMCCMDIPSALNGGEAVYTNELPDRVYYMHSLRTVSDNPELVNLKCFNPPAEYEKYGNYRIQYTKLNKFVLEIEKLD